MEQQRLILAASTIAGVPESADAIAALTSVGFSRVEATTLVDVLPEAFAVPVLEDLGVSSFSDEASARTRRGKWVRVVLNECPVFVAALNLAREHRSVGVMPNDIFKSIAGSSALVDAANRGLKLRRVSRRKHSHNFL